MVLRFHQPPENPMDANEAECPLCLVRMQPEEREGADWLVCPNGCPTEFEAPIPKPVATETGTPEVLRARAAGS
jgi:hypothetical protein